MSVATSSIKRVFARQILDSRGRPTIEVEVTLRDGSFGRACAPTGASKGRHEACELRDDDESVFEGRGVLNAVKNVNTAIAARISGVESLDQAALDAMLVTLDGSGSLARLGANAILATSLATCRAAAEHSHTPLHRYIAALVPGRSMSMPLPMANILSGGAHAQRGMDFQDFLVVPHGARSYGAALEMIARVRSSAARLMSSEGMSTLLADEGGLSPGFASASQAMDFMLRAFEAAQLRPAEDVSIAVDVAASELFDGVHYQLAREQRSLTRPEMTAYIRRLAHDYPLFSVEDALDQDDWEGWRTLTASLQGVQIVGDDLFVTSEQRIAEGIVRGAANAALIKVNQNGTLSGTLAAMRAAWRGGYATVVSARSGETEDSFIADLAVGTGAGQIKIGSVRNSERLAKYNQLLRIEADPDAAWAGVPAARGRP